MRSIFPGYFRPNDQDFKKHWKESIFVVDANVLLNLYRYSEVTRKELQEAITSLQGRLFIPHQAASEFLRNRLTVTSDQSKEYTSAIKTIKDLVKKISSKDRHPFINEDKLNELNDLSSHVVNNLEEQQSSLLKKLSSDEILEFIESAFEGKTGIPFDDDRIKEIIKLGEKRYEAKIPPGYKDSNKDSTEDPTRKYGDLLVWLQTLDYAKENSCSVVFITDDKKEDWWLEQSGRTISPRPELIEEFIQETKQNFWMYSVSKFIQETASINKKEVNPDVMEEILKISERLEKITKEANEIVFKSKKSISPSINSSQEVSICNESENVGFIVVTLEHPMKYASGSGKFRPFLTDVPDFSVDFIEGPESSNEEIHISYGCGTNKDFNVHLKAKTGELAAGDYVFQYQAMTDEYIDQEVETTGA
jgi:predicted nucleic acid-binding protein